MKNTNKNLQIIEKLAEIGQETNNTTAHYFNSSTDIETDIFGLIRLISSNISGIYRVTYGKDVILWED